MTRAAIIGCGTIGGGWAARLALMGWDVAVFDTDPGAEARFAPVMAAARRALPMLYEAPMPAPGAVRFCATLEEAVAGADWVQESVPEDEALKREVLAAIGAAAPEGALIASSSAGLRASVLQQGQAAAERILVASPANPAYLLPLVELLPGMRNSAQVVEAARRLLEGAGLAPMLARAESDGRVAERLQQALWREALWLVREGRATTQEIDAAIMEGFGLGLAQGGLFEGLRAGGLEAALRKLPEELGVDAALVETAAAQAGGPGEAGTEAALRQRDDGLVALLRALKMQEMSAGRGLRAGDARLRAPLEETVPMVTVRRIVPADWTDVNGHMNEGRYGQLFSDAAEELMHHVGADSAYIEAGHSYFTVETSVKYLDETHAGEAITVGTRITQGEGKKLRVSHEMRGAEDGGLRATCDQFMLHVSLETRRTCPPLPQVLENVERLARQHAQEAETAEG